MKGLVFAVFPCSVFLLSGCADSAPPPEPSAAYEITVNGEPATAGIDPWHKLVDRHPNDNEVDVERTPDA